MAQNTCPYCGDTVSPLSKCCPTCGSPLTAETAPPTPSPSPAAPPSARPPQFKGLPAAPKEERGKNRKWLPIISIIAFVGLVGFLGVRLLEDLQHSYYAGKNVIQLESPEESPAACDSASESAACDSTVSAQYTAPATSNKKEAAQKNEKEEGTVGADEHKDADSGSNTASGSAGSLYGTLSTIDHAGREMVFSLNGSTGSYHFSGSDNATRTLQLESHNPSGRTLVYKAYLRGRYIGKFKGKYTLQNMGSSSYMDYNCTFISVNGARINYSLSGTIDGDY